MQLHFCNYIDAAKNNVFDGINKHMRVWESHIFSHVTIKPSLTHPIFCCSALFHFLIQVQMIWCIRLWHLVSMVFKQNWLTAKLIKTSRVSYYQKWFICQFLQYAYKNKSLGVINGQVKVLCEQKSHQFLCYGPLEGASFLWPNKNESDQHGKTLYISNFD